MMPDDAPTLRLHPGLDSGLDLADDAEPSTEQPTGLMTMLFGLSLATALPPAAMLAPPGGARPAFRPELGAIVTPLELATILDRPAVEIWRGRVALGQVDKRLGGLEILLGVFQVTERSPALVCLSVIRPDSAAGGTGRATPADVWALACEALARFSVTHEPQAGIGEDAFLALYGSVTAQVAWVTGDRLATVSVTCLGGTRTWLVAAARSIAVFLDGRLARSLPNQTTRRPTPAAMRGRRLGARGGERGGP
jgi:hypothetical protein